MPILDVSVQDQAFTCPCFIIRLTKQHKAYYFLVLTRMGKLTLAVCHSLRGRKVGQLVETRTELTAHAQPLSTLLSNAVLCRQRFCSNQYIG